MALTCYSGWKAFLNGRQQRVVINGKTSNWTDVLSGIPQGSILGPVLFILFINDLSGVVLVGSVCRLFADDCKLYRNIKSEADLRELQKEIWRLYQWSKDWLLGFNFKKCKVVSYGKCQFENAASKLEIWSDLTGGRRSEQTMCWGQACIPRWVWKPVRSDDLLRYCLWLPKIPIFHLVFTDFCHTCFSMSDLGMQVSIRLSARPFVHPTFTMGVLWAQLLLQFFTDRFETWQMILHGVRMCMWFGYNC